MEKIIKWLNYLGYVSWPFMFLLGILVIILVALLKFKDYLYRREISMQLKICYILGFISFLIGNLIDKKNIFNIIFFINSEIIFLSIFVLYVLDKIFFYKFKLKNAGVEKLFLEIIMYITYCFILISGLYGIKYFLFSTIWLISFTSIKFYINNIKDSEEKIYNTLYDSRKDQIKTVEKYIEESKDEECNGSAIAINGEWGSGKTQFLKALMERQKEKNYCIYIKSMMLDTRESLITEFQNSLYNIMSENGIYCGRNSSLEKYFKAVFKLIQVSTKISLSDIIIQNDGNISYRQLKKNIQDDIDVLLDYYIKNKREKYVKKLIIIIDDFDRIEEKRQLDILEFINEIVDFNGTLVLFALDYDNIKGEIVTQDYLEKFISLSINLCNIKYKEVVDYYIKIRDKLNFDEGKIENRYILGILNEIKNNICNYYDDFENSIIKLEDEKEDENKITKKSLEILLQQTNNSRKVVYFLDEIKRTIIVMDAFYNKSDRVENVLGDIEISKIIYLMNFAKIFLGQVYDEILSCNKMEKFLKKYDSNLKGNINKNASDEVKIFLYLLKPILKKQGLNILSGQEEMIRNNYFKLIENIFINYESLNNNVQLLTESEKIVKEIRENKISIDENYIQTIYVYQIDIYKECQYEEEKVEPILNNFIKYIVQELIQNKRISIVDFFQIAGSNVDKINIRYCINYLEIINDYLGKFKVKINKEEFGKINLCINKMQFQSIGVYIRYFEILEQEIFNEDIKCNEFTLELDKISEKYNNMSNKKYTMVTYENVKNIKEKAISVFNKMEKRKIKCTDIELLKKRVGEFIKLNILIEDIRKFVYSTDKELEYEQLFQSFSNSISIEVIILKLEELSKQAKLDYYMIAYFFRLLECIIKKNYISQVEDEDKKNIEAIRSKFGIRECSNDEILFLNISIDCDRILNSN